MKKIYFPFAFLASIFLLGSCDWVDSEPVSSITDNQFWQTEDQFDAFMTGLHARFREHSYTFFELGEARSDVFTIPPGSTTSAGMERLPFNTMNEENPAITGFGNFYQNINQLNLIIEKASTSTALSEESNNYYQGQAYGMRAYYYFHLLRSWGSVVIATEPTYSLDVSNLTKASSPVADVMALIKEDINKSNKCFGSNYTFKGQKTLWSKSATLMLQAEVYLWSSRQMNGGAADATIAKNALTDIQKNATGLDLMENYADVFDYNQKGNKEIIFAVHNQLKEYDLLGGNFGGSFLPHAAGLGMYYDIRTGQPFDVKKENRFGLLLLVIKNESLARFDDKDNRKAVTLMPTYLKNDKTDKLELSYVFVYKYQGVQDAGSNRSLVDDYPIYRYADLLLLLAEAKSVLGESPAGEINQVRQRAYGKNYDQATVGYPHQTIDKDANDAILEERYKEFIMEGKRWYDLRRYGNDYVYKYTLADKSNPNKLLWPIDQTTLTNNSLLKQTPGYEAIGSDK